MHHATRATAVALLGASWFGLSMAEPAPALSTPEAIHAVPIYRSAFLGYRPFADQAVQPWRASNETVEKIGGWQAYAREAAGQPGVPASHVDGTSSSLTASPAASASASAPGHPATNDHAEHIQPMEHRQ